MQLPPELTPYSSSRYQRPQLPRRDRPRTIFEKALAAASSFNHELQYESITELPTTACSTSTFASTLDSITYQIKDAADEYGFSQVLMP